MKKLFLCAMMAMFAFTAVAQELNVGSFNIRNGSPLREGQARPTKGDYKNYNGWDDRKQYVCDMINLEAFDVFGSQEVKHKQLVEMMAMLPDYDYVGVARDDGAQKGEYCPVFYRKKEFKLLDSGTFWLSETPDQVSRGWDAALPRITTWVKLRDKATKRKFFYFNTHFDHKGTTARVESSKLIVEKIREIAGKKAAVVLTGDFNIESENEALQPLFDNMSAARRCAPITDNKGTYNGWGLMKRYTVIDHIFYGGRKVKCNAFRTLDGDYGAKFISDHFPLEAIFTIR